jgi:glutamate--cysteine ligase
LTPHLHSQLQTLAGPGYADLLQRIQRGLEKESLRITPEGRLAQTRHPAGLGSALTHSSITTDYSEALLEFITPVDTSIEQSLDTLADIHRFTYSKIGDEMLWATSMPCVVNGDDSIPVAEYGNANVARMKKVYRYGLGHRYGRLMQTIAGIHYNFSLPADYWQRAWDDAGNPSTLQDYVTDRYLGLIRNFHRHSWLLIYLFGASPAVCASFLRGLDNQGLEPFDDTGRTLHRPWGTALRMGDLGYNSKAQKGLTVCYNSLDNYVLALRDAIMHPHPPYQAFPAGQQGDYQQLNDSLLQIENEFYSTIRPKRVTQPGEAPLAALRRAGIEYVEVRCIDVSPFSPVGINASQMRFLDTFLMYCLLENSPACGDAERALQTDNFNAVVNRGRKPGLRLRTARGDAPMSTLATDLLDDMSGIASLLDAAHSSTLYEAARAEQQAKVSDSNLTPSARVLQEMRDQDLPFFRLAMAYSEHWARHFREQPLSETSRQRFEDETRQSLEAQHRLEAQEDIDFDEYLARFFGQYRTLF